MKELSWLRVAVLGLAAVVVTSACGPTPLSTSQSSDDYYDDDVVAGTVPDAGEVGDTTCFLPLNAEQQQKMQEYAAQPGVADQANTVDSVCVMEPEADGTYVEHYYQEKDNFPLFLAFALLTKHSGSVMTYGLLAGQITPAEYVLLSTLVCIRNDGRMYHPYTKLSDGSWVRQRQDLVYKVA
ncbi:MAG TPA: hypothetical protein VFT59_05525, partial [Candidatus Saccharimonadales bacterium]|nr:hypothetical protein [Candidatus Saccharimonadales bacterium]